MKKIFTILYSILTIFILRFFILFILLSTYTDYPLLPNSSIIIDDTHMIDASIFYVLAICIPILIFIGLLLLFLPNKKKDDVK